MSVPSRSARAVPMRPCPASTACPGTTSIVPLTRFVLTTVPDTLARRPWSVPAAMSGTGFAAAASATSFPFVKLRLAQENSPLWSRAYSPAVSLSCVTIFPGKRPAFHRTTAARACWPGVSPTGSMNQTKPWSQSRSGRKTRHPAQSPRRRNRGRRRKKSPQRFWMRSRTRRLRARAASFR